MTHLTRRQFVHGLALTGGMTTCVTRAQATNQASAGRCGMGLVAYSCHIRRQQGLQKNPQNDLYELDSFLDHCVAVGAGGAQLSVGSVRQEQIRPLRERLERSGLYLEGIVRCPKDAGDVARFTKELRIAQQLGIKAARTTMIPGRRYEYFKTLDAFRRAEKRGVKALKRAAPIAERMKIRLAVENHKDHRVEDRIRVFKELDSAYVGACVDTGNSLALLEDPVTTAREMAPWAHSVHLKDQAVKPYRDGFLLGDIPLGQGAIDLKRIVALLRKARPKIRFSLELITRDPLKVPVLNAGYWRTFPRLPASELARTMAFVRDKATQNLQYVTRLTPPKQLALEDANIEQSLRYAQKELGL